MAVDVVAAEVVLPCGELTPTLEFFTSELGFRVEQISPADSPVAAVIRGHGLRLRLDSRATGPPGTISMRRAGGGVSETITAPNGTVIELAPREQSLVVPPLVPSLVVSHAADAADFGAGRAGMQYRDLVPDRQGGRFIASHIRIPDGGEVPDYVHFHRIGFQLIYCARGWVKVVYEDQGGPFVMHEGDCVLQPPLIRHRVLEASPGMEVVEVGSPAVHDTFGDLEMSLPTVRVDAARDFGGQRFIRHVARDASWEVWNHPGGPSPGFECRDTGVSAASAGAVGARVVRAAGGTATPLVAHDGELLLMFVLGGSATVDVAGRRIPLAPADSVTIPRDEPFRLADCSTDLELLEVTAPGPLNLVPVPGRA